MKLRKLKYENLPELNSERWLSLENLEGEVWRPIPKYFGYMASKYGRIKSLDRAIDYEGSRCGIHFHRSKVLKGHINKKGYIAVTIRSDRVECRRIQQLVMMAFRKMPKDCDQINHKDENKLNNCLYNLEYCNQHYNNMYGTRRQRIREKVINDVRRSRKVNQYTLSGEFIACYPSLRQVERDFGYQHNHISGACRGVLKTAYGYLWSWA